MAQTLEQRFWGKVNKRGPNECWPWTAARHKYGYGCFRIGKKWHRASRIAWELSTGKKPAQHLGVLHRCDNPSCCNPHHLFLGTQLDNVRDMAAKGRRVNHLGEDHGRSVLTTADVKIIRATPFRRGAFTELAERLGVAKNTIGDIYRRRTWRHV